MIRESFGSASDRLLVAVLVAVVLHAGLIFGVRFRLPDPPTIKRHLDIELIQQVATKRPARADYLAQADSEGGIRQLSQSEPPAAPPAARSGPPRSRASAPRPETVPRNRRPTPKHLTQDHADASLPMDNQAEETGAKPQLDRRLLASQIADLGVVPTRAVVQFSSAKRVVPIHRISTHKYIASAYERAWQEKVERIGNLNYPDEARRKGLSGALLISVWVASDGTVKQIKIHRSSGYRVLDDAAIRIMRLAAPFSPFPKELADQADVIVITRTWKFYNEAGLAMGR